MFLAPCQFMSYINMYTRDVKLSFPNNSIKKFTLWIFTLCHNFDQFSGEWPIYMYIHLRLYPLGEFNQLTLDGHQRWQTKAVKKIDHNYKYVQCQNELLPTKWRYLFCCQWTSFCWLLIDWVIDLIDDRLYSAILRSPEQTHCARMWIYMSD